MKCMRQLAINLSGRYLRRTSGKGVVWVGVDVIMANEAEPYALCDVGVALRMHHERDFGLQEFGIWELSFVPWRTTESTVGRITTSI